MNVCAITMVRDDLFYVEKWIQYYSSQLGSSNLFVLVHGNDEAIRSLDSNVNFINIPTRSDDTIGRPKFNKDRFFLINSLANSLQAYFDFVIVTDADEYIAVDPNRDQSLPEYLREFQEPITLSAFGLDIYQHVDMHPDTINLSQPIIQQRPICKIEPLYCKPAITSKKITRAIGNHYSNDRVLTFAPDLYLFHLKYMDRSFSLANQLRRDRLRKGEDIDIERFPHDDGGDFKYRNSINSRFAKISQLPISESFNFEREKNAYVRSWRRRRFWAQKDFYSMLIQGNLSDYSFHWRFDLTRYDTLHIVPERFYGVI